MNAQYHSSSDTAAVMRTRPGKIALANEAELLIIRTTRATATRDKSVLVAIHHLKRVHKSNQAELR